MTQQPTKKIGENILVVRKLAQSRLANFSRLDPVECKESYLFDHEKFCGIRFSLGRFNAEWRLSETRIQFVRNGNQIGVVDIDSTGARRAA